jgi:hypothetical protein
VSSKNIISYPAPTIKTYGDPSGQHVFNASRRQLHSEIVNIFFQEAEQRRKMVENDRIAQAKKAARKQRGSTENTDSIAINQEDDPFKPGSSDDPVLILLSGGPGSGKSTLAKWLQNKGALDGPIVSLTLSSFAALPEFKEIARSTNHPHPEKSPTLVDEFYYLRHLVFTECVKRKVSMTVDDHLDHPDQDKAFLAYAKKNGFLTIGVGMTINPYPYFYDVKRLIEDGKTPDHRHTPWALQIHRDIADNWEALSRSFDFSFLYQKYNNYQRPVKLIAQQEMALYATSGLEIIDREDYERFKNWRNVNVQAKTVEEAFPPEPNEDHGHYLRRVGRDERRSGERGELRSGKKHQASGGFVYRLKEAANAAIQNPISPS